VVAGVFLIIPFSILFEFTVFTDYYLVILGALTPSSTPITAIF
jgi:NADH:ubiquinone oxidoreductase subunit 5 (subunit L)/multisubunit Na+/H+ antiporter MnhA subunit